MLPSLIYISYFSVFAPPVSLLTSADAAYLQSGEHMVVVKPAFALTIFVNVVFLILPYNYTYIHVEAIIY